MATPPATATVHQHGTYEAEYGVRQVVIVRYGSADYAVIDELKVPRDGDHDERFVESALVSFEEAEALAIDYIENARHARKPLVGVI